jgi:flagellar biogenesis protein FliO
MRGSEPRLAAGAFVLALVFFVLWPQEATAQGAGEPQGTPGESGIESDGSTVDREDWRGREPYRRSRPTSADESASGSFGGRYLRTLGWLVLVVGLAVGSIFLLRRFSPGAIPPQNRKLVQVIGRGALGPKHQVVVTRVGERILMLGLAPDTIVPLGEVEDPREVVRMTPPEETFAGRITLSEAAYREDDAEQGDTDDKNLEPYRREIDRLRGMVEVWQRQDRIDAGGGSA